MIQLVLAALVGFMALVAIGAVAQQQLSGQAPMATGRDLARLAILLILPPALGAALVFARRYIGSDRPALAEDHRRHLEVSLVVTFLTATAVQAWQAASLVQGAPFDRTLFIRSITAWLGIALVMRANFMPKLGPPTGDGAPDPVRFSLSMRKAARFLIAGGLVLVGAALLAPLKVLFVIMLGLGAFIPLVVLRQRRAVEGPAP